MKYSYVLILLLLFMWTNVSRAQLNKWMTRDIFGTAYLIDFTQTPPLVSVPMPGYGYTIGPSDSENNNLITDSTSRLLFSSLVYGNHLIEVRDSTFNTMPNGDSLISNSSVQQSAISKVPCSSNKFYLVHSSIQPSDLYYSEIDMSLNGGSGDVAGKNILLGNGYGEGKAFTHQLKNGCRWLLCVKIIDYNTCSVHRFLVSQSGITFSHALDTIVLAQPLNGTPFEIEISSDNKKVALSTCRLFSSDNDIVTWNFDLETGTLSNMTGYSVSSDQIAGIEFSPDGNKLYFVGNTTGDDSDLGRLNLLTGQIDIIDSITGRYIFSIELAGNGRIYVSQNYNSQYLPEVMYPDSNNISSIGYNKLGLQIIGAGGLRTSLPNGIEGESPGTVFTPQYIDFNVLETGTCMEFQFMDSSCLGTWWEWNFGDSTFSNAQNPIHQYSQQGIYDITLRMVACGDTLTLTKNDFVAATANVQLHPFSDLCISNPPLQLSGGFPPGGAYSGTGISNGVFNPAIAGVGTHTISYNWTDSSGCGGSAQQAITVHPFPIIPVLSLVNDTVFATDDPAYVSYTWFLNGNLLAGLTDSILVPVLGGNYTLLVTDTNGCSVAVNLFVSLTSVVNFNDSGSLSTFPNPFDGELIISLNKMPAQSLSLKLVSAIGQLMWQSDSSHQGGHKINIITSHLAKGLYILHISSRAKSVAVKLIKQ